MGQQDSTSAKILKAIANAPEPVDRLNLLSRWIVSKLEDLSAAEQRIDKRMETLKTTESSLNNLLEALRKQVIETQPVLKELAQTRASALTAVEQVVRATSAPKPQPAPATTIDPKLQE